MMLPKPTSSLENNLNPNSGLKCILGNSVPDSNLGDKGWLNQYLTLFKSGSGPELCTWCSSAVPHTRPVYNIHVGDCSYASFRVIVLHFNNPIDLNGRGSNWLNSPDCQWFFSASLVYTTMCYLTIKSQGIISQKKHVENVQNYSYLLNKWRHAREDSIHLWCQMFALPLKCKLNCLLITLLLHETVL